VQVRRDQARVRVHLVRVRVRVHLGLEQVPVRQDLVRGQGLVVWDLG
jgi:hypothetical protein